MSEGTDNLEERPDRPNAWKSGKAGIWAKGNLVSDVKGLTYLTVTVR